MKKEDIIQNPQDYDLSIETVGMGTLRSPMSGVRFVSDEQRVCLTTDMQTLEQLSSNHLPVPSLEAAGPRETIYHDPSWTRAAIVPSLQRTWRGGCFRY